MLKVVKIGQGRSAVVLTCDECAERMASPHEAVYTWREYLPTSFEEDSTLYSLQELCQFPLYVDDGKIFTLHKGACFTHFQATHGGEEYRWPVVEMVYLPGLLINNLGMTFTCAQEHYQSLDTGE